jgi:hypothetical protein
MSYICRDCLADVGTGDAILRSVSFQVVAYCRPCWEKHEDMVVPTPRRSVDEAAEAAGS